MRSVVTPSNRGGPCKVLRIKSSIFGDENRKIFSKVNHLKECNRNLQLLSCRNLTVNNGPSAELRKPQYSSSKSYKPIISGKYVATDHTNNVSQQVLEAEHVNHIICFNGKKCLSLQSADLTLNILKSRSKILPIFTNRSIKCILGKRKEKYIASRTYVTYLPGEDNLILQESRTKSEPLKLLEKSLQEKLLARPAILIYDHLAATPSQLLKTTLISYLPFIKSCSDMELRNKGKFSLPPGHHLVYFHQQIATSKLLPDGTDDLHSPGYPFERRLWVGGSIEFTRPLILFPKIQMVCSERITDVRVTGTQNDEKIFVDITRQIINPYSNSLEIQELRTLVFMRRINSKEITERKIPPKPRMKPHFSIIVRPTRELLFRFSALTFNSHRIHLDSTYCRQVEGLKSMIVQGPLTVVLMLAVLKEQLWNRARIDSFTYRNIVPLYVEEDMRICVKKGAKINGTSTWHVWIEGPLGGYAVKGTATISWVGEQTKIKNNSKTLTPTNKDLFRNQVVDGSLEKIRKTSVGLSVNQKFISRDSVEIYSK